MRRRSQSTGMPGSAAGPGSGDGTGDGTDSGETGVFVISLPGCTHRLEQMRRHLAEIGLPHEVMWAHDARAPAGMIGLPAEPGVPPGVAGCWFSHWRAAAEIVRRGLERGLVLEDDARFTVSGGEVHRLLDELPAGWDCALLHRQHWWPGTGNGAQPWEKMDVLTPGTYTIAWSAAGARRFLSEGALIRGHVDGWLRNGTPHWSKWQHAPGVALHADGEVTVRDALSGCWRIPRIIHQIWTGPAPLPEREQRWHRQWAVLNDALGWRVHLWRDRELEAEFPALWHAWRHLPASPKSDIFRAAILLRHGGIYADTDMEPLMPVEHLVRDAAFVFGEEQPGTPGTAWLASAPGHPLTKAYLREVLAGAAEGSSRSTPAPLSAGEPPPQNGGAPPDQVPFSISVAFPGGESGAHSGAQQGEGSGLILPAASGLPRTIGAGIAAPVRRCRPRRTPPPQNWGSLTGPGALVRAMLTEPRPAGALFQMHGIELGWTFNNGLRLLRVPVLYPFYLGESPRYLPGTFAAHHWAFSWGKGGA